MLSKTLNFLEYFLDDTIRVAEEIPGVTDSYLRNKMASLKILEEREIMRVKEHLDKFGLTRVKLKRMKKDDPIREEHDSLHKRINSYSRERQHIEEVLHARLTLKDEGGLAHKMAELGYFERRKISIAPDKAVKAFQGRYPS